jgi:hypothetical protein
MRTLRRYRLSLLRTGTALSLAAPALVASTAVSATGVTARPYPAGVVHSAGVRPNRFGELDCNGLSPIQRPVKPDLACVDPRGPDGGRFYENGHYIGHDQPSVRFISARPGSGNNVTMTETLPRDPKAPPIVQHPGGDVTHWFELSNAPWISMSVCDPDSAPLTPCTPRSDANAPHGRYPGAGSAFVELQFYPPGYAPLVDSISCDDTHWCSALTITSEECTISFTCNFNCFAPTNYALIQTDGIPAGPPSPQRADLATFTPNSHTLLMDPGDVVTIHMWDARIPGGNALEVRETDHTTGRSGLMIASARNGFMNTNPFTCAGTHFSFQPEYSTARAQNYLRWSVGPYMINTEYEIGHWEACTSVHGKGTFTNGSFKDTYYKHCEGPYETPVDNPHGLEHNDEPCYKKGDTHGGIVAPDPVAGCVAYFGDVDFDGSPYWPDWPHSLAAGRFPSPFLQQQPTTDGHRYPRIQFMSTISSAELRTCDPFTGKGCVLPPKGAHVYPYFTLAKIRGACVWEFGTMPNGNTFGRDRQYGKPGPGTVEAFASPVRRNPSC